MHIEVFLRALFCSHAKSVFNICWYSFCFILIFLFLGLYMRHMEVPRLGVKSELQLPAYAAATAMPDGTTSATYTTAYSNMGSLTH